MEAAERVATFLRVLDQVWPNHPDRILTTGAATSLLKSDLHALVSGRTSGELSETTKQDAIIEKCADLAECAEPDDGRDHSECPFCCTAKEIRSLKGQP